MNMVQSLGRDYFNSFFAGALFKRDADILRVTETTRYNVLCYDLSNSREVEIPFDFFTGFKTFEYPTLGYRRVRDGVSVFLTRRQSTNRGLRHNAMEVQLTPATAALNDMGLIYARMSEQDRALAAYNTSFDTVADIPRLLRGEASSLILSPYILIEPGVETADDWYSIYFKRAKVGTMNDRGTISWNNPIHANILENV